MNISVQSPEFAWAIYGWRTPKCVPLQRHSVGLLSLNISSCLKSSLSITRFQIAGYVQKWEFTV